MARSGPPQLGTTNDVQVSGINSWTPCGPWSGLCNRGRCASPFVLPTSGGPTSLASPTRSGSSSAPTAFTSWLFSITSETTAPSWNNGAGPPGRSGHRGAFSRGSQNQASPFRGAPPLTPLIHHGFSAKTGHPPERQRRSILQPRVGACAYPGSEASPAYPPPVFLIRSSLSRRSSDCLSAGSSCRTVRAISTASSAWPVWRSRFT
jgi:hypothetical protein